MLLMMIQSSFVFAVKKEKKDTLRRRLRYMNTQLPPQDRELPASKS